MSRARLLIAALAAGAVLAAVLLWPAEPPPAPRAVGSAGLSRPAGPVAAPVAPAPQAERAATALSGAVLRAALVEHLHAAVLPRELVERLLAGDVGAAARRLLAAREPGSAAALADLATLCRELEAHGADGDAAAEARAALGPAAQDPATTAALEALIAARRDARTRLAAGCAAAGFDAGAIERKLASSAADGDAASLERLALAGQTAKLTSAALLGAPRAQLRLALEHERDQPQVARSWLEAAAKGDADAEAYYGTCLLSGCAAAADPAAARVALESAARRGAPFALGLLASGAGADDPYRWSPPGALVTPVAPHGLEALGLDTASRYAWAALAGSFAGQGCFGFDLRLAAEALAARPRLERALSPADVAAGELAARELEATSAADIRHARGCD